MGDSKRNRGSRCDGVDVGGSVAGVKPNYDHRLLLIVVVVDVGPMSVGAVVSGADGGVFIIVVLTALVSGARVVHPVRQVGLQPLGRERADIKKKNQRNHQPLSRDLLGKSAPTNIKLIDAEAADKVFL